MGDYRKISELNSKISKVLEAVGNNAGQFSAIDKDLLTSYIRQLYELTVILQPDSNPPLQPITELASEVENIDVTKVREEKVQTVSSADLHQTQHMEPGLIAGKEAAVPVMNPEVTKTEDTLNKAQSAKEPVIKKSISDLFAEKKDNGGATLNDRYKNQGKEIADTLKHTPIKALKSYIGLNKRVNFINRLFNGAEQQYDDAITQLDNFGSYHDALKYVQQQLTPAYQWKEEEPLVTEFFTLLMRRYLN